MWIYVKINLSYFHIFSFLWFSSHDLVLYINFTHVAALNTAAEDVTH